jgi:DNA-binding NarL/FixJ family response regulator
MTNRIRVLIVDDSRLMRDGLCALLNAHPDLHVVATAANMIDGLRQLAEVAPDVVLLDAGLASDDPNRSVQQIRTGVNQARVIVIDLPPAAEDVVAFAKAGASGFMTKDAAVEDLVDTVRSVARGTDVIPPTFAQTLLEYIARGMVMGGPPAVEGAVRLTTREREVMELIADGMGNKAIAHRLGVADDTVKSHVRNMLEKLALHSRLEIAAHSHKAGLPAARGRRQRIG